MPSNPPMLTSQRVVQVCLFLVAAIVMFGGALQMYLGEPDTSARLDNVHRFMAGVYFSTGFITLYLIPELLLPVVIALTHLATSRNAWDGKRE